NNICIISDILLNRGYNLVEDVPALKDEDVRAWKDLPFTDIAFPLLQAQQFAAKNIGVNSRAYTKTLQLLSTFAVKKKEPNRARAYLVEMQAIEEKRVPKNHPDYCLALIYWGKYYQATARYDSAEAILIGVIQKCKAFPPETTWPIYSEALESLMEVYRSTGRYYDIASLVNERYELAVKYNLEGLLARDFIGNPKYTNWQDYANAFHQLGLSFAYKVYDYPKAIEYYQKASKVVAQYCRDETSALSWQISNGTKLGWAYMLSDRNDLADPLFEAAIQAGKKSGNAYYAQKEAAQYYIETNRPRRAEACLKEVAATTERQNGRASRGYLQVMKQVAWMYLDDGQFQRADSILQEAKSIVDRAVGKENAAYCQILNQLGTLHRITGDYSQSEACLLEAKGLIEKMIEGRAPCGNCLISGDIKQDKAQHEDYSGCLIQLGLVYTDLGQFARADNLLQAALGVYQEIQQRNPNFSQDRSIASLLNNIGFNYWNGGKAEEAERYFKKSLALWEKIVGKKKADYILALHSLADWYFTEGRYEEAEPLYQEVSTFWAESGAKSQQAYLGMAQHYLAMLYENTGRPSLAEPLYRKAEAAFMASIGPENGYYAAFAFSLGQFYARQGHYVEAMAQLYRSNILEQQLLRRGSAHLSEGELQNLVAQLKRSSDLQASLAFVRPAKVAGLPELLYDNTLFYKGFLLEGRLRLERTMRQADSVSIRKYNGWKTVQRQLALEYAKPISAREDVAMLETRANSLEKELTRRVAGLEQAQRQINWQQVQQILRPGEAALEFVHFRHVFPNLADSVLYAALLILPGTDAPRFIPLFEEKQLDSLFGQTSVRKTDYVNNLYAVAERGARPVGKPQKTLYELIWQPLEKEMEEVK
ncbi:MAG: tetratricopeptide repeat protein, partial [Thermoanaerobaculia bacterium]|nr:tetratricopeptide repeat protein [Thermoanaerobaculia bacterium]